MSKRGFTIIELLVVIAIIGLLSAGILAALTPSRNKSKDISAQQRMSQGRAAAEIAYNGNGRTYVNVCPTFSNGQPIAAGSAGDAASFYRALSSAREALTSDAGTSSDTPGTLGYVSCTSNASAFAASIKLNTNSYCFDSTGFAGLRATNGITAGHACPAN